MFYLLNYAYKRIIEFKYILLSGVMFSLFVISLFQEATFGLNYTGVLIIMVGFAVSKIQEEMKDTRKVYK